MIGRHYKIPLSSVTKCGPGSEFIAAGNGRAEQPSGMKQFAHGVPPDCFRVVIVGAGPAGIGTAVALSKLNISPVLLIDRSAEVGGVPAMYEVKPSGVPTFVVRSRGRVLFGRQFAVQLAHELRQTGSTVWLESQVINVDKATKSLTLVNPRGKTTVSADAIVFACGAREKTRSERGWITGDRPARQFYTMQLLQLLDGCHALPAEHPAIIGSDLIAYSAAAKLRAAGSEEPIMFDRLSRPAARVWERLYFRKWSRPAWHATGGNIAIADALCVTRIRSIDRDYSCDGVVFSGDLIPNSELVAAAGLELTRPDQIPVTIRRNELSELGWFIAGAERGGLHGADWCYRDGRRAALAVARYLSRRGPS
jgi:pyruvate/2-oxoglutarate dehydrogenase complex dihydrolipoamide dehydrogenase (E3) component